MRDMRMRESDRYEKIGFSSIMAKNPHRPTVNQIVRRLCKDDRYKKSLRGLKDLTDVDKMVIEIWNSSESLNEASINTGLSRNVLNHMMKKFIRHGYDLKDLFEKEAAA